MINISLSWDVIEKILNTHLQNEYKGMFKINNIKLMCRNLNQSDCEIFNKPEYLLIEIKKAEEEIKNE